MSNLEKIDIGSKVFKDLVLDVMIKKGVAFLLTFFKISPAGWVATLISKIVFHYTDKAFPYLVKFIKVRDIKFENAIHQRSYEIASYKLRIIAHEKGENSEEFKNARKVEHEKQAALVIFNIQYS